jgi:hypothetical protein
LTSLAGEKAISIYSADRFFYPFKLCTYYLNPRVDIYFNDNGSDTARSIVDKFEFEAGDMSLVWVVECKPKLGDCSNRV